MNNSRDKKQVLKFKLYFSAKVYPSFQDFKIFQLNPVFSKIV